MTILGHRKLCSFRPHLLKKVQLNFANGKKRESDQLLIWVHIEKKQAIFASKSFFKRLHSQKLLCLFVSKLAVTGKDTKGEDPARGSLRNGKKYRDLLRTDSKSPLLTLSLQPKLRKGFAITIVIQAKTRLAVYLCMSSARQA